MSQPTHRTFAWITRGISGIPWIGRVLSGILRLAPPLVVAAAIVALLRTDPANRVAYLKTLAWPSVVVLGYLALRDPIHERLGSVQRLSFGGADIEFQKRLVADAREALQQTAREVAETVVAEPEATTTPDPAVLEHQRRLALEEALKAGAKWGYNMAPLYATPPEPVIEWDEDGKPTITGTDGVHRDPRSDNTMPTRPYSGSWTWRDAPPMPDVVAAAENEVRRLEADSFQSRHALTLDPTTGLWTRKGRDPKVAEQLEAAKKRLAEIDPNNRLLL